MVRFRRGEASNVEGYRYRRKRRADCVRPQKTNQFVRTRIELKLKKRRGGERGEGARGVQERGG